ncbi:formate dehydrogenase accessory protein FdhE domain-containing protein [Nonomuraea sp. SYSU D8015]|uniref:formate dehydrogenase accessory protein FdhE domain-containing protein n=1 Tax=Nonomuraea sp. SYSU D8015 TaxID=2593644 RepID=UPI00166142F9|nr:formate dehydrogenase accessory protein FdhE [Nonomuraea sp. SYSU D8015]
MFARDRVRAGELRERYPHAAEVLRLYLALVEVWELVRERVPADGTVEWARSYVLPRVVEATAAHGPPLLAAAVAGTRAGGDGLLHAWLAHDEDLTPVERYLARATMRVVPVQPIPATNPGGCPACGGPPQVSYRTAGDDPLVSGRRMLQCARCAHEWSFSATTCPNCGETGERTLHAEAGAEPVGPRIGRGAAADSSVFPHLRAESCETCHHYLIDVDLGRDPRAVPPVDELAAVPIDLHMADQGYTKITPNLMGF